MSYKYALFDLDGTLLASAPGIMRCIKETLDNNKVRYNPDDLPKMIGPPFRVSMTKYCGMTIEEAEKFIVEYRQRYNDYGWKMSEIYDGIPELLQKLKSHDIKLATATSKPEIFTKKMLDFHNLTCYFDFIGSAVNDKSRETKQDVVNWTISNLGVEKKEEAIMIGDRLYDIEGARDCGLDTIAVLWGYGSEKEFREYNARYICRFPTDVEKIII